jgi:hypothetical protein
MLTGLGGLNESQNRQGEAFVIDDEQAKSWGRQSFDTFVRGVTRSWAMPSVSPLDGFGFVILGKPHRSEKIPQGLHGAHGVLYSSPTWSGAKAKLTFKN